MKNPDAIKKFEFSIAREIAGLRHEVNQLRIQNRKLIDKMTDQPKVVSTND